MKAIVQDGYGSADVLRLREVADPVAGEEEVLVQVRAAGCGPDVWHLMTGLPYFARLVPQVRKARGAPRGRDVAGVVEAVGPRVADLKPGDEVMGVVEGSFAELAVGRADRLVRKPSRLTFEEAAAAPISGLTALQALRDVARIRSGQTALVIGAGGGVGTLTVQIAKAFGASVTGVCSGAKADLVRSIGADDVIDYTREDLTKRGPIFDVVIDAVGKYAYHWGRRALKPGGIYVETDFGPYKLETLVIAIATRWLGSRRLKFAGGRRSKADVQFMKELIEGGAYRPVIDRTYPIEQVAEAHRYVETWHKTGNVVLTL